MTMMHFLRFKGGQGFHFLTFFFVSLSFKNNYIIAKFLIYRIWMANFVCKLNFFLMFMTSLLSLCSFLHDGKLTNKEKKIVFCKEEIIKTTLSTPSFSLSLPFSLSLSLLPSILMPFFFSTTILNRSNSNTQVSLNISLLNM